MSIRETGAAFVAEVSDAVERLKEAEVAQLARQARYEAQLLELQGETRGVLKKLLEGQEELKQLLTTNGSGGNVR